MSKTLRQNLGLSNIFENSLILNQQFPKENVFPSSAAVLSTFSHNFLEVSLVWHYFNTPVSPVVLQISIIQQKLGSLWKRTPQSSKPQLFKIT